MYNSVLYIVKFLPLIHITESSCKEKHDYLKFVKKKKPFLLYHFCVVYSCLCGGMSINLIQPLIAHGSFVHFTPFSTLQQVYRSLIFPNLSYGLVAWSQAAQSHLDNILMLLF